MTSGVAADCPSCGKQFTYLRGRELPETQAGGVLSRQSGHIDPQNLYGPHGRGRPLGVRTPLERRFESTQRVDPVRNRVERQNLQPRPGRVERCLGAVPERELEL